MISICKNTLTMNLTVKITEQVEKKLEAVLKGRYDNRTICMYYKVSLHVLRDAVEDIMASHYTIHPLAEKDLYYEQSRIQVSNWIKWIQNRTSSDKLVDLDRLLSKLIEDKARLLEEALEEKDSSQRMTLLSTLQMAIQIALFTEVQQLIKSPITIKLCEENGWAL
jgi:hypothetical protein